METMTDALANDVLPPGVAPEDPSVPYGPGDRLPNDSPVGEDGAQAYSTRPPAFPVNNPRALPVYQRAASDWTGRVVTVDSNNGGTALAVGRVKGRDAVTIWVPSTLPNGTTPNGVIIGPSEDEVQQGLNSGIVLNPGDSISIRSEAAVWVGLIGANTSGACQVMQEFNPNETPGF